MNYDNKLDACTSGSQQKQGQKGFLLSLFFVFNLLKKRAEIIYVNARRWFSN